MFLLKSNLLKVISLFSFLICALTIMPVTTKADSLLNGQVGMDQVSQSYGGANANDVADPRSVVANIINVTLLVLGSIFIVLLVVAGFLYMTAAGDADQVKKALTYIKTSIIGLIIILSAWSITYFVFRGGDAYKTGGLLQATNARNQQ